MSILRIGSMKKYFARITVLLMLSGCQSIDLSPEIRLNPELPSVNPDFTGNPFYGNRFIGPFRSVENGTDNLWRYVKWKLSAKKQSHGSSNASTVLVQQYKQSEQSQRPHIAWLGHATILIHINNKTILIDPILTSPRVFHGNRLNPTPVVSSELEIDYLLATHAHRDHLDKQTVVNLGGDNILALVPLEVDKLLHRWRPDLKTQSAGWYQTYNMKSDITITLLPSYHWSRRNLFDTNTMLWGSYMISIGDLSLYIAGDTGYASHFKDIARIYKDIDYAVLPIGSYSPSHIHGNGHLTPEQAVSAYRDLNAKVMIPVHYGTYSLSAVPVNEPLARLKAISSNLPLGSVRILNIGESLPLTCSGCEQNEI